MWFTKQEKEKIVSCIESIGLDDVYICDRNWTTLIFVGDNISPTNSFINTLSSSDDPREESNRNQMKIHPFCFSREIMGYIILPMCKANQSSMFYLLSLMYMSLRCSTKIKYSALQEARTLLTNQIAFYGKMNWEIMTFSKELNYSFSFPRCAVLFSLSGYDSKTIQNNLDTMCSIQHSLSLHASPEDIYGSISQNKFLVFKKVDGDNYLDQINNAKNYAKSIITTIENIFHVNINSYVGSPYEHIEKINNSFVEAQFLDRYSIFLNIYGESCSSIDEHIFAFLSNQLSQQHQETLFGDLELTFAKDNVLLETMKILARNNFNQTKASENMGKHRNTIQQRFEKIQNELSMNPLYSDTDRAALYSYSLYKSQNITWRACVNIQPGSIQHKGLNKLSELLRKKSAGIFNLDIELLSKAGDYRQLLESVCSGKIDCVCVNTSVLFKSLNDLPHLFELPFLFDSSQEADFLLNTYFKNELYSSLDSINAILAGFWSMGWRNLTSTTPIYVPNDMQGKKVRVMHTAALMSDFFEKIGASVIKAYYSEIPQALDIGIICCQENPYSNILDMEFYLQQKYVLELNAFYDVNAVLFSKQSWSRLPAGFHSIIESAISETNQWMLAEAEKANEYARDVLIHKGMNIIKPTIDQVDLWRNAGEMLHKQLSDHPILIRLKQKKEIFHDRESYI